MQFNATELKAKLFRGFSDTSRLGILETLRQGPRMVSEIVEMTGLSQPNVSNHLGCLRECGLVKREQVMELGDVLVADLAKGFYECTRYAEGKNEEPCRP
jgi:ArsR family transcriptional regulator, cadmium/lead-responsive transcriptional repressor